MEIPSKDICVQVYFPQVMKNTQTNCQCASSQFIASKTQETHSRGNTDAVKRLLMDQQSTQMPSPLLMIMFVALPFITGTLCLHLLRPVASVIFDSFLHKIIVVLFLLKKACTFRPN